MFTTNTLSTNKSSLNYLISLMPLSLILGNLAINLNIIIICIIGIFTFKFRLVEVNEKKILYIIYIFFFYLIFITLFRNLPNLDINPLYKNHIIKSFLYLRYLVFFLVINKLIEEKKFDIKFFFLSCSFFSFLVAFDVLIQFFFKKNLLGYAILNNTPSSFFGEELIAGGYIQRFAFFFIFSIFFFFNNLTKKINFFLLFFISFFFFAILLTTNRMPLVIFLASIFIFLLIEKKTRKLLIISFFSFIIILTITLKSNEGKKENLKSFVGNTLQLLVKAPHLFYTDGTGELISFSNNYLITFNSAVQTWKENKIFGGGLKSIRINCKIKKNTICTTHPHNYTLEILLDTGILGFFLIYSVFIFYFFNYIKFYLRNLNFKSRIFSMPFFLVIFFEFFPLRSSGSFFSTNNSVIIFLFLAIFINVSKFNLNEKN